jgi:hypothetical protein
MTHSGPACRPNVGVYISSRPQLSKRRETKLPLNREGIYSALRNGGGGAVCSAQEDVAQIFLPELQRLDQMAFMDLPDSLG